jgi:hypothetical protein
MDTAKELLVAISWGGSKLNKLVNALDLLWLTYRHGG